MNIWIKLLPFAHLTEFCEDQPEDYINYKRTFIILSKQYLARHTVEDPN